MNRTELIENLVGDREERRRLYLLLLGAAAIRWISAWMLGEGAAFGPDGTGAEAAVHLGGHIYPSHIFLIGIFGSAQTLSLVLGSLSVLLMWSYGRTVGLGEGGAWLMATMPMAVYPSVIAAGDAPALFFVLLGATIAVHCPREGAKAWWQVAGGLLALSSVTIKPIALPALVLLMPRPRAAIGALLLAPAFRHWMQPLLEPKQGSGLLGSWWRGSEGAPPTDWMEWLLTGAESLFSQPLWTCAWLIPLAALSTIIGETREARWDPWARWTGVAALGAGLAIACLFGDKLEARYLAPAIVASLPWVGAWAPSWSSLLLAWPTLALLSQLAALRADLDPLSAPPSPFLISPPRIEVQPLFDNASTPDASELREDASHLADILEPGQSFTIERRLHGREGELLWPLQVLRTDLEIGPDPDRPHTHILVQVTD